MQYILYILLTLIGVFEKTKERKMKKKKSSVNSRLCNSGADDAQAYKYRLAAAVHRGPVFPLSPLGFVYSQPLGLLCLCTALTLAEKSGNTMYSADSLTDFDRCLPHCLCDSLIRENKRSICNTPAVSLAGTVTRLSSIVSKPLNNKCFLPAR